MASKIQIYINSQFATKNMNSTKNSDMLFLFTSPIVPPQDHNMTIKLLNLYLPISFTNIDYVNKELYMDNTLYTISEGNYNANTLATELASLLGLTISFNTTTNKFTFTSSTSDFTFNSTSNCLYILGFDPDVDTTSTSKTLTSTYPVDLTGDNVLYVDIRNISTPNLTSLTGTKTSIVKSVLLNVPYGSILFYENQEDAYHVIQEDHLSFFHIRLLGEDQQTLLDMNNFDWSMTLEIGFVPKQQQPALINNFADIYNKYLSQLIKK